ncbi:MAG: thermostable hemolysin [Alphaproteobacteria bacterium]|nr:thermostable hemolysin [Alphaproteobacteria bacterium]
MLNLRYSENGLDTGKLSFRKDGLLGRLKARPSVVSIVPAFAKDREAVEDFITGIYAASYNAHIRIHYPMLMSVRDESGQILAATGFRPASEGDLFLEQYLEAPAEDILQAPRKEIVEIGNLASDGGGASLYLFAALATYLHYRGFTQAVVTSTDFLETRFKQIGLQPKRHAKADPALLLRDNEDWGTYYDTQPHVMSGAVAQGYKRLQCQLGIEYQDCRPRLYPRLHYKSKE